VVRCGVASKRAHQMERCCFVRRIVHAPRVRRVDRSQARRCLHDAIDELPAKAVVGVAKAHKVEQWPPLPPGNVRVPGN
jgi:hypothetical protein